MNKISGEQNLAMAVIFNAVQDLAKNDASLRSADLADKRDAEDFIFTERLEDFLDYWEIELDISMIRRYAKMVVEGKALVIKHYQASPKDYYQDQSYSEESSLAECRRNATTLEELALWFEQEYGEAQTPQSQSGPCQVE